jgi:hypothetical protein
MSALPSKADMPIPLTEVRFVPKADIRLQVQYRDLTA